MGTFSWVIVVIVLLQVIAGAVTKSAEKRKAMEKAKEFRKEALGKSSASSEASTSTFQQKPSKIIVDLDTLREQRLKKLRTPASPPPAPKRTMPQPVDLDADLSPKVAQQELAQERPLQQPPERPARSQPSRASKKKKPPRTSGSPSGSIASAKAGAASESFAGSLLSSKTAMKSEIFDNPIRQTQIGTELGRDKDASPNAMVLDAMLQSTEDLRHGILLAELLQPPVSLRQEGAGGLA